MEEVSDAVQALQLRNEIWNVIRRFEAEYDLSVASAIGTMEIVKMELAKRYEEPPAKDDHHSSATT